MTPDPAAAMEEQADLLLAACDEAVVAGKSAAAIIPVNTPAELRDRLEGDVAWCRMARRLLRSPETRSFSGTDTRAHFSQTGATEIKHLGRFEVRRELGRGGFGVVFLAFDPKLGREVNLKVPRPEAIVQPELRARFQHEARATAILEHPNLVPVYEAGEVDSICYIASAYCPGQTLSAWLTEQTAPVPFNLTARLVATLAEAVEHAHRRGILHRDLKPGNVMLSPRVESGEGSNLGHPPTGAHGSELNVIPRIMDFGLAKVLQDESDAVTREFRTQTSALLGTPSYMAPEQAGGGSKSIGTATDVHALGIILYELLAGRSPFRGEDTVETLVRVRTQEPLAPSRVRPKLPRDPETICLKCLQKDPQKRYSTAQALADDLNRYLTRRPIEARRVTWLGRGVLWCKRNPALAVTLTSAVLAVSLVAGAGLYQVFQERERLRDERDRVRANLYRALVGEARSLMQARDTGWWRKAMENIRQAGTLEIAARHPDELRELAIQCMGTDYPCMRLHATGVGHGGPVTCTAFGPDGTLVASGSRDQTVRLWAVPQGRPVAVLTGHEKAVTGVAFHPNGLRLASGSADGTVRWWDLSALTRSPNPGGSDEQPATHLAPAQVMHLNAGAVNAPDWSPDGGLLVAACQDGTVRSIITSGREAAQADRVLSGHRGPVTCLAFSESGQLVSGSEDSSIRFWDLPAGKETDCWLSVNSISTITFSPDYGGALTWTGPATFGVDRTTLDKGKKWAFGDLHASAIRQIRTVHQVPYQNGKIRLLTASADGSIRLWRFVVASGNHLQEDAVAAGTWGAVNTASVNRGGNWVAGGYADGRIRLWELAEPPQRTVIENGKHQTAAFVGKQKISLNDNLLDFSDGWGGPVQSYLPKAFSALTVHPDGRRVACADGTGNVSIGEAKRNGNVLKCGGHSKSVTDLCAGPTGELLASVSSDGTAKLWDWETGECRRTFEPGVGSLHGVAWSGDGRSLAVLGDRGVAVCEPDREPAVRILRRQSLRTCKVAAAADVLVFGGPEGTLVVCDFRSGRELHVLHGHKHLVSALAFSADGKLLASCAADEGVRLWDVDTGFAERTVSDAPWQGFSSLSFDPRGRYLIGSSTSLPYSPVWDVRVRPAAPVAYIEGRRARFTADGSAVLFGTDFGSLQMYTVSEIEEVRAQAQSKSKSAPTTFVPVRTPSTTCLVGGHSLAVWGISASPDGRWFATASHDQTVKLWDVRSRKLARTLEGHNEIVWSVAFSRDSQYRASGSATEESGCVKVWDVATGREHRTFLGHKRLVFGVCFHPTRPWLASGSADGSVYLWDVTGGNSPGLLHQFDRSVYSVAFHPSGRWLAASGLDNRVALWDLAEAPTGPTAPARFLDGHTAGVCSVGFSADGRYLASGSDEGVIILWDGQTFERVTTLRAGTGQLRGLSFSHDGQLLAGAAYQRPTVVWNLDLVQKTLAAMKLDW